MSLVEVRDRLGRVANILLVRPGGRVGGGLKGQPAPGVEVQGVRSRLSWRPFAEGSPLVCSHLKDDRTRERRRLRPCVTALRSRHWAAQVLAKKRFLNVLAIELFGATAEGDVPEGSQPLTTRPLPVRPPASTKYRRCIVIGTR